MFRKHLILISVTVELEPDPGHSVEGRNILRSTYQSIYIAF